MEKPKSPGMATVNKHVRKKKNGATVVKTHKRSIGTHMKSVHKVGKALFGDKWKQHSKHAMGCAHGLNKKTIKRSQIGSHLQSKIGS